MCQRWRLTRHDSMRLPPVMTWAWTKITAGLECVWRGYGTGMERVWSRLPPNPLQLRSSTGADTGEKSIKNEGSGTSATFPSLAPSFSALFLFPPPAEPVRPGYACGIRGQCEANAWG